MKVFELGVNRRVLASSLVVVVCALGVAHFIFVPARLPGWEAVNIDAEGSVAAWFSTFVLAGAALLAFLLAAQRKVNGERWLEVAGLGVVLLGFSVEEVADFHSRLSSSVADGLHTGGGVMGGTPLLGLLLLPLFGLGLVALFRAVEPRLARSIAIGTALFVVSAFGLEEFESWNSQGLAFFAGHDRLLTDAILVGVQESVEMLAAVVVVVGLLTSLGDRSPRLLLTFDSDAEATQLPPRSQGASLPAASRPTSDGEPTGLHAGDHAAGMVTPAADAALPRAVRKNSS